MGFRLAQQVSQTTDANGALSVSFPQPKSGTVWTGTISCPAAPGTAAFTVTVGPNQIGAWNGPSPFGPVQAVESETITVHATGLTANTQYNFLFLGSNDNIEDVQWQFPIPTGTANATANVNFNQFMSDAIESLFVTTVVFPPNVISLAETIITWLSDSIPTLFTSLASITGSETINPWLSDSIGALHT
jgi:hypothetical protein